MRTLILSDIHANAPALKTVLNAAGKYDRIVFLGDLANFDPHPTECVDILPNTPDEDIEKAFESHITPGIDQVWFGHYHYHIERKINGITYQCFRPVGHHRDKDIRASYYIYEDNVLRHKKIAYDLTRTISDFQALNIFEDVARKQPFVELLEKAYQEQLLKKDIEQMKRNQKRGK